MKDKEQELIEMEKFINESNLFRDKEGAIRKVKSYLSINSKALDKIPNVIDNEAKKKFCWNCYGFGEVEWCDELIPCEKCNGTGKN